MKKSEILIQAKALIDAPEKWTQGVLARNAEGKEVDPWLPEAACFCSVGALQAIEDSIDGYPSRLVRHFLQGAMQTPRIARFNDTHTHAEVMAAWDHAIAQALREESK